MKVICDLRSEFEVNLIFAVNFLRSEFEALIFFQAS